MRAAGDTAAYNALLADVVPARFKVGQVILSFAALIGAAYAMYRNVDADKKAQYKPMFLSAGLAVFLTGVTEPIEFMFMFVAPVLYVVYALMAGAAFALADIIDLRVHAFGAIELLTRIPMIVKAGLLQDLINFVLVSVVFFFLNFGVFNFFIKKMNLPTPGRNGNYMEETTEKSSVTGNEQVMGIIALLGGEENIEDVDACMTRLRVTVKDVTLVSDEQEWKKNGAMGLIVKDRGVQAIYGPKADVLKSDIQDVIGA